VRLKFRFMLRDAPSNPSALCIEVLLEEILGRMRFSVATIFEALAERDRFLRIRHQF
jgi:hypothetical protein